MKKLVIKYQPNCFHLLNYGIECVIEFKDKHMKDQKMGILNGVLWVVNNSKKEREHQIYVYHTKTQIVCDIR